MRVRFAVFFSAILACSQCRESFTIDNSKFTLKKRFHQKEIALDSPSLATGEQQADRLIGCLLSLAVCVFFGFGIAEMGSSCKPFGSQMDLGVCYLC